MLITFCNSRKVKHYYKKILHQTHKTPPYLCLLTCRKYRDNRDTRLALNTSALLNAVKKQ